MNWHVASWDTDTILGFASINLSRRVSLIGDERDELLAVVDKGRAPVTQIKHANILHAVLRMTDAQAAAAYYSTTQTVRAVKRQFV